MRYILATIGLVLVLTGGAAHAEPTVTVRPSLAPNAFGSPSWPGYVANALSALENGTPSVGNPSATPTAYANVSQIVPGQNIVSNFPSWLGQANPGSVFGPAFANELGNRLHFGLHVVGNGTQFNLAGLGFSILSTDPGNSLAFSDTNFVGFPYSAHRVGIDYVDGIKGNGNDIVYNSGQSEFNLIDELIYVGVGNAWDASFEPGPTDQDKLNQAIAAVGTNPFLIIGTYTVGRATGNANAFTITPLASGSATVLVTPEPASLAVWSILGAAGAVYGWRRRKA